MADFLPIFSQPYLLCRASQTGSIVNSFNRLAHSQVPSLSLAYLPQMALTARGFPIFNRSLSHAFVTELSRLSLDEIARFNSARSSRSSLTKARTLAKSSATAF